MTLLVTDTRMIRSVLWLEGKTKVVLSSSLIFCTYIWCFYATFLCPKGESTLFQYFLSSFLCFATCPFVYPVCRICTPCTKLFSVLNFCVNWMPFTCHYTLLCLPLWWSLLSEILVHCVWLYHDTKCEQGVVKLIKFHRITEC